MAAEVTDTSRAIVTAPTMSVARATANGESTISAFSNEANFTTSQRMAKALASSSLMPEAFRGNVANCVIAMELAHRTGASVLMVAQNLDIIHGRPSWRATFLIATVNSSGKFTPLRFRWSGKEGTDSWGCRAVAKDIKDGEECLGALITIGLAKSEGWTSKSGSKWKTMPEQMLMYRAAAFWTRIYSPELSLGMHTSEEMADVFGHDLSLAGPTAMDVKALEQSIIDAAPAKSSEPKVEKKSETVTPDGEVVDDGRDDAGAEEHFAGREPGED